MKYFVDSANLDKVVYWKNKLGKSFAGITTNRTMLINYDDIERFLYDSKEGVFNNDEIHNLTIMMQPMNMEAAYLIEDANNNDKWINFVMKFPIIKNYMEMIQNFCARKPQVCATSMYNLVQLEQAAEFGVDWSMVYYNKNPDRNFLFEASSRYENTLVAASLRDTDDVIEAIRANYSYATVKPAVLEKLFNNKLSLEELNE